MLSIEFIEQNFHFALSLFAALTFFAVFWLYFDAWLAETHKTKQDTLKWIGFLVVSVSFVLYATTVEQETLSRFFATTVVLFVSEGLRLFGYIVIIVSQVLDPIQKRPVTKDIVETLPPENPQLPNQPVTKLPVAGVALTGANGFGAIVALPAAALVIAALYWRKATTGIERHLKPVAVAFLFLFIFELLSMAQLFRSTANPALYDLVKAYGPLWIASLVSLFVSAILLGRWVWKYLTERFLSQLFMTFTSTILFIFLVTTISFTFLLLRSIQNDALNNLVTATSVLNYALDSNKAQTEADSEALAANPAVASAITSKNHKALLALTSDYLKEKRLSSLVITTADAQVLLRAENPTRWGDSISSDTLVRRALIGTTSSTIATQTGVLAPVVSVYSVVPVRDASNQVIGTVSTKLAIDNAFVDGLKDATGLDSAVYSGNVRSATTLTTPDGTSRWIGVKETNPAVQTTVLKNGKVFSGQLSILNRQYLAVYAPLKDIDNSIIGMVFIGQTQLALLQTTAYLIALTFVVSVVLLVLAVIPAYLLARQITKQLE